MEILEKRYPQLSFLLSFEKSEKKSHLLEEAYDSAFLDKIKSQKIKLLVLLGLGSSEFLEIISSLIKQTSLQDIIVLEEDLSVIKRFTSSPRASSVLDNPQIHLRYLLKGKTLYQALEEIVEEYPAETVHIEAVTSFYKDHEALKELSLFTLRKATIASSLFNEEMYYHLLSRNLLKNFSGLSKSFYADALKGQFNAIPAVVCGAGPSLKKHIQLLQNIGNKALIIGGGSTLAALSSQGVEPHIGLALDPNPEEYERFKANQNLMLPILFSNRVLPEIFCGMNGPKGYMRTFSGGYLEQALEEKLELTLPPLQKGMSEESLSVTVMCLAVAIHLGCNPIFLSGIDLAYTEGKRYAEGVLSDAAIRFDESQKNAKASDCIFRRKNRDGEEVWTNTKWVMESTAIEDLALLYKDQKIIDSVEGGLGFSRLPACSLEEGIEKYLIKEYDIKGLIHRSLQMAPNFDKKEEEIEAFLREIKSSLLRLKACIANLLNAIAGSQNPEEDSLVTLYTMDSEEEIAFIYFLAPIEEKFSYFISEEFRITDDESMDQKKLFLKKKWEHFASLIDHYLVML